LKSKFSKQSFQTINLRENVSQYSCCSCNQKLFSQNEVILHDKINKQEKKVDFNTGEVIECDIACSAYFISIQSWIKCESSQGLISCPNSDCGNMIGTYSFKGLKCKCGKVVKPGFLIYYDLLKVNN
jgi:hypothetical protein